MEDQRGQLVPARMPEGRVGQPGHQRESRDHVGRGGDQVGRADQLQVGSHEGEGIRRGREFKYGATPNESGTTVSSRNIQQPTANNNEGNAVMVVNEQSEDDHIRVVGCWLLDVAC
jgi:hypothetical protein